MTTPTDIDLTGRVPYDSFGTRIAIIRRELSWNYREAGMACGISHDNWRLWEKTDRLPQRYAEMCRRIADGSGFSEQWITMGGPLRPPDLPTSQSRCSELLSA